jgi:hypothetical protein
MGRDRKSVAKSATNDNANQSTGSGSPIAEVGAVPSAKELLKGAAVPSQAATLTKLGEAGEVHFYELPYCLDASVYGAQFESEDAQIVGMKAVHMISNDYPNPLYYFLGYLKAHFAAKNGSEASFPKDMATFEKEYSIKIIITRDEDVDKVGTFKKNRTVAYVKDAPLIVKDFYCFMDGYLTWRPTFKMQASDPEVASGIKMIVHTDAASALVFEASDEMECPVEVRKDIASQSVNVFEAYPPTFPARPVVLTLEAESQNFVSLVFSGNTQPFRTEFDKEQIARKGVPQAKGHNEWYRLIHEANLAVPETRQWLLELLETRVLKGSPLFLKLKNIPGNDHVFASFVRDLCAKPQVQRIEASK